MYLCLEKFFSISLFCSAILIRVAIIGFARQPDFEVHPPNAISTRERIAYALLHRKVFRDACEKEGVDLQVAERMVESGVKREMKRERREKEQEQRKRRHRSKL